MRKLVLSAILITCTWWATAQHNYDLNNTTQTFWLQHRDMDVRADISSLARDIHSVDLDHTFHIRQESTDQLGMTHIRLVQLYQNIPVFGAQTIIHVVDGKVKSSNGVLANNFITTGDGSMIPNDQAILIAKSILPSTMMAHKHEAFSDMGPTSNLVWFAPATVKEPVYRLAYQVNVYSLKPHYQFDYFIDAYTGKEIGRINKLIEEGVPHTAETLFLGEQEIIVDSLGPEEFILYDESRNIRTTSLDIDRNNERVISNNNEIWAQSNYIYGELDAHWGTEMTHDYFETVLNRNSVDDQGMAMNSKIIRGFGLQNAFWNGSYSLFGAGNGSGVRPFSVLDVVGHEFTHGVVQFSAGLIYQGESGALNESFADILGKSVEYHTVPSTFTWEQGRGIYGPERGIRNLEDPKKYSNPSLYNGEFWASTSAEMDNGGVHTNSGVQNFWFYLLSAGQSGTNEQGLDYNVPAIGLEKAEQIAYRNLVYYLTPSSSYSDAVSGSIQAAIDLYGLCSDEQKAVIEAWRAVGLWSVSADDNFYRVEAIEGVESACGIEDINLSILLSRRHCRDMVDPSQVQLTIYVDEQAPFTVLADVTSLENYGDLIQIEVEELINVSDLGIHTITVQIRSDNQDVVPTSRSISFENRLQQNADFITVSGGGVNSSCDISNESLTGRFMFNGCDRIEAGEQMDISYLYNEDESTRITESYTLTQTLFPGDEFEYTFQTIRNVDAEGQYRIFLDIDYPTDPFPENNIDQVTRIFHSRSIDKFQEFKFLRPNQVDEEFSYLNIGENVSWEINNNRRHLLLFGGFPTNFQTGELNVSFPTSEEEMWENNRGYKNQYCFCIDAQEWPGGALISYDRAVKRSSYYDTIGFNPTDIKYASALRLVANDTEQIGPSIYGYSEHLDSALVYTRDSIMLDQLGGQYFDLCFESHHFIGTSDFYGHDPDGAHIDNIIIEENIILGTQEEQHLSSITQLFPNPVKAELHVILPENVKAKQLTVRTIDGRAISSTHQNQSSHILLNTSHLHAGFYTIEVITTKDHRINKPFIKM